MPQNPIPALGNSLTPGNSSTPNRIGYQGESLTADRHARDYEAANAQAIFTGANSLATPVTTSVGLATTYVGLCLSNPAASGKKLVLLSAAAALLVAPTLITTLGLIVGYAAGGITAHTTALTPLCSYLNGAAGVGLVDSACTLVGTPAYAKILGQAPTATTSFSIDRDINGAIIIPPGGYVAFGTNIAGPASGFVGSFVWEEVAIPA